MEDKVTIINRSSSTVVYSIPDLKVRRSFNAGARKEIPSDEIKALLMERGGYDLFMNNFVIYGQSKDYIEKLIGKQEPEYFYTAEDVKKLLLEGTLDELMDCLDFAPDGVIDLVKKYAVELEINDIQKRKAIKDKTGLNITNVIKNKSETKEEKIEKIRRVGTSDENTEEKPVEKKRRVTIKKED
jgi:hypothetical protein